VQKPYNISGGDVVRKIHVNIYPEWEGNFFAVAPDLHECYAFGDTAEEAQANVREIIAAYLSDEPDDYSLVFDMRKHEPKDDLSSCEMYDKSFASFDELLEDLMNDDEV